MSDETPQKRTRRTRPAGGDATRPPAGADYTAMGGGADPDAALHRLESMGSSGQAPVQPPPQRATAQPASRPMGSSVKASRARPRPAGSRGGMRSVTRIAAPLVFLVAVIALVSIAMQSGILGGAEPTPTPTPKVTKTKGGSATQAGTRQYTVKSGDTLSAIADRFGTTTSELEALNPDLSASTLVVGVKIVVPTTE